ncbi:MAG: hypothetical protein WA996_15685 [Candidatus Promineifilaceae bacterium]
MKQQSTCKRFPTVGDGSGFAPSDKLYQNEVRLALRNRDMPLEGLRALDWAQRRLRQRSGHDPRGTA